GIIHSFFAGANDNAIVLIQPYLIFGGFFTAFILFLKRKQSKLDLSFIFYSTILLILYIFFVFHFKRYFAFKYASITLPFVVIISSYTFIYFVNFLKNKYLKLLSFLVLILTFNYLAFSFVVFPSILDYHPAPVTGETHENIKDAV